MVSSSEDGRKKGVGSLCGGWGSPCAQTRVEECFTKIFGGLKSIHVHLGFLDELLQGIEIKFHSPLSVSSQINFVWLFNIRSLLNDIFPI